MTENQKRANKACKAIEAAYFSPLQTRIEDSDVIDLLIDLRHLCARMDYDFEKFVRISGNHFRAESGQK